MESPGAQIKGNDVKQNRSELIQKAINYAQKETRLIFTGERHVRDAMIVYLAAKASAGSDAVVEVVLDMETGEIFRFTVLDAKSVLHEYPVDRRPDKPNPN